MELMATGDRGKAVLKVAQKLMERKEEVEAIFLKQLSAESLSKNPSGQSQAGLGLEAEQSPWGVRQRAATRTRT